MNTSIILGNLTRDPELRHLPKGTAIASFTIANNRRWKADDGEKKEEVTFIDCDAFGKTAETIAQYFQKGASILVRGRIKQDTWEDKKTGQKRSKLKIVVEEFSFVGGGKKSEAEPEQPKRTIDKADVPKLEDDSELPF